MQEAISPFENVSVYTPNCYYWSSTDYDATKAWGFSLGYGVDDPLRKDQYSYVMAVRNVPEPSAIFLAGIGFLWVVGKRSILKERGGVS